MQFIKISTWCLFWNNSVDSAKLLQNKTMINDCLLVSLSERPNTWFSNTRKFKCIILYLLNFCKANFYYNFVLHSNYFLMEIRFKKMWTVSCIILSDLFITLCKHLIAFVVLEGFNSSVVLIAPLMTYPSTCLYYEI